MGLKVKSWRPLGKGSLNVYSHARSGNPPPAPKSGSEIRRSICSADGAPLGAPLVSLDVVPALFGWYCLWRSARNQRTQYFF